MRIITFSPSLSNTGSEDVVRYARDNVYIVKTLKEFQYIDEDGKDQGSNGKCQGAAVAVLLDQRRSFKQDGAYSGRPGGRFVSMPRSPNQTLS